MTTSVDPILVSVIASRLEGITHEMGQTMLKTSRSPIFSEARDFVTAIFDRQCRLAAQTHYIPVIGGATPFAMKAIADAFAGNIDPGDVFILNDPYSGNNHPPDVTIVKPVFHQDKLCFWTMAKGHHADVGGGGVAGYNPAAKDCWEDSLRIPPAKVYEKGKLRKDMWDMILLNVRIPFLVEGDLHCQVGAATIGERRLLALLENYGIETVEAVIQEILDSSERQVRDEIGGIPDGTYRAERLIDHDGINQDQVVKVSLAITVSGDEITFDYTGSNKQVQGFLNSPIPNTVSSTHLGFFPCLGPDVRYNAGAIRPIHVVAPEGSLLNPTPPAPTTACTVPTAETITECVWIALAEAIPSRVQAPWARWCAPATLGVNPRTGGIFADIHFISKGGGGATEGFDGWDHLGTVVCLGGLRSPDPELHELVNPYLLLEYQYLPDSAGAGRWRGGLGVAYRWKVLADGISCANFGSGARPDTAPVGLQGGLGAPPYALRLRKADGVVSVDANNFYELDTGDEFEILSSGGGGFGDPRTRPIESVVADVRDGVVSAAKAREAYGVAIDPDSLVVDKKVTAELRRTK